MKHTPPAEPIAIASIPGVTLEALKDYAGKPVISVTVQHPAACIEFAQVTKRMLTAEKAKKFVEGADEDACHRGASWANSQVGALVTGLNRALTAPMSEINARVMRSGRRK